jgi:hypothetical protein
VLASTALISANFGELRACEVRRIFLLGTRVNNAASVSVYTGVGTFWGSGEKESDCWDNRRAPNKEADLLNFYTTTVRSKNIKQVVTVGAILRTEHVNILLRTSNRRSSQNSPSTHSGE